MVRLCIYQVEGQEWGRQLCGGNIPLVLHTCRVGLTVILSDEVGKHILGYGTSALVDYCVWLVGRKTRTYCCALCSAFPLWILFDVS